MSPVPPRIVSVSAAPGHGFSKALKEDITLIAGFGVEGDAHGGATVKHRSRVARDPSQPNLRQVHLIMQETLDDLAEQGFDVAPAQIGENVLTQGVNLLALPKGAVLTLGETAKVEITGLRNPCVQLNDFQPGLMKALVGKKPDGTPDLKAGVMGVVLAGGPVKPGDAVSIDLPPEPHQALERV